MTKRNKSSVLLERNANKQQRGRIVKDKFLEEKQERINEKPLRALNPKQQKYIEYINTKNLVIATGYAGTSKAQPLYSKILTSEGWKTMGDMVVGEVVITPKNTLSKVLEVHKFENKRVFRLTFASGRTVDACEDHLWEVRCVSKTSRGKHQDNIVMCTKEILEKMDASNISIPLCKSIGSITDVKYFIDPYVMGILLAEGCLGPTISFSTSDQFILDKVSNWANLNNLHIVKLNGKYDYAIRDKGKGKKNSVIEEIKRLGLWNKRSESKFIPDEYLSGSIEQRLELIRGIMDGDGGAGRTRRKNSSSLSYSSASKVMAEQLQNLLFSVGAYAKLSEHTTSFRYKGIKKSGKMSYRLYINHPTPKILFNLPRKIQVCSDLYQGGKYELMDKIVSIDYVGNDEVWCIMIDDEDHLYLTDNYVVTHNTYIPTVMACDKYLQGEITKIVLTRPNISNSKSLGMFKGTLIEKFSPWLAPVLSILTERLGIAELTSALEKGNIEFVPLEVIKGYSANDCFFICDEAEDLTKDEAKKLVTRQGRNCTMVLAGDITQSELKESSGLKYLMQLANKYQSLNVGCIDFDNFQEIVRSDQAREWVKVFAREEKETK